MKAKHASCWFWAFYFLLGPFSQSEHKVDCLLRRKRVLHFLMLPLQLLPPVRCKDSLWVVEFSFEDAAPLVGCSIKTEIGVALIRLTYLVIFDCDKDTF